MDDSSTRHQSDHEARQEAYAKAQACEAVGDHAGALELLEPWAKDLNGPGTAGLQLLLVLSLERVGHHTEAEAALARYASVHPYYPMEQLARGAEAWRTGDWWTVVLSYLKALTIDPALKALWERATIAIRQLKDSGDDGKATEPEALRLACLKAAEGEISVDWLLFYTEAIELLPVDINWHRQCNEAAHKARDLLTAYGHNQTKDTNEQER